MTTLTDHEVFWLARYAHNVIAPIVAEARKYEPSTQFDIEMSFCNEDSPFHKANHVTVWVRAKGQPNDHVAHETVTTTRAQVDALAVRVQEFIGIRQTKAEVAALEPAFTF